MRRHEMALAIQEEAHTIQVDSSLLADTAGEKGYGLDPNLITPSTPWSCALSDYQRQFIDALSDIFLPATTNHPAPSEIGISGFFDEWLSAPYTRQKSQRDVIVPGLSWIEWASALKFGRGFLELTVQQRTEIVDTLANLPDSDKSASVRKFFTLFRYLVVGGYFTSDPGLAAIGYRGNVPLTDYPGTPADVSQIVDEELRKLGL